MYAIHHTIQPGSFIYFLNFTLNKPHTYLLTIMVTFMRTVFQSFICNNMFYITGINPHWNWNWMNLDHCRKSSMRNYSVTPVLVNTFWSINFILPEKVRNQVKGIENKKKTWKSCATRSSSRLLRFLLLSNCKVRSRACERWSRFFNFCLWRHGAVGRVPW